MAGQQSDADHHGLSNGQAGSNASELDLRAERENDPAI